MRVGFWKGAGMTACNSQAMTSQVPPCSRLEQVTFFFFFYYGLLPKLHTCNVKHLCPALFFGSLTLLTDEM